MTQFFKNRRLDALSLRHSWATCSPSVCVLWTSRTHLFTAYNEFRRPNASPKVATFNTVDNHSLARKCRNVINTTSKVMEKTPDSAVRKCLTDNYQNSQGRLRPGGLPLCKNCITIRLENFAPCIYEVAYQMFTWLFWGFFQLSSPRPLRRFWRSIRRNMSIRTRTYLLGHWDPENEILCSDTIFPKTKIFGRFSTVLAKHWL